eukprot:3700559-Rhodomonas_salina.1
MLFLLRLLSVAFRCFPLLSVTPFRAGAGAGPCRHPPLARVCSCGQNKKRTDSGGGAGQSPSTSRKRSPSRFVFQCGALFPELEFRGRAPHARWQGTCFLCLGSSALSSASLIRVSVKPVPVDSRRYLLSSRALLAHSPSVVLPRGLTSLEGK